MNILRLVFTGLFLLSLICAIRGLMYKRKNIGFVIASLMIATVDILCVFILGIDNVKEASNRYLLYFLLHAWSLFAFLLMLLGIEKKRSNKIFLAITGLICCYQTYLVVSQYRGDRIFSFSKRIFFRKAFWVAVDDSKNTGIFFSYFSYRLCIYINIILILLALLICIAKTHKIFRSRYYAFATIVGSYMLSEILKVYFAFPVWIPCIAYNLVPVLCLFYTESYAKRKLREWSLDSFANDMSDGLILYDKQNDLIHLNDMVKNTLSPRLLESFRDREALKRWIEESREEGNEGVISYTGVDREYYFKVYVRALGETDGPIGTLFILHDTTDSIIRLKVMEQANEELERASRMKSDFLANMSHEIRTPMNAVIGMAELAMHETDRAKTEDYLLQIQSSGRNLLNIINDILDYSKIESGKMDILEEEYEPFEEYLDIANVVATRIGGKPLELFIIVETALPKKLRGDAMRIRQILINLMNNAVKFTAEGFVRVMIKCENIETGTAKLTFHVVDTGIGIKPEDLEKLFISFQQLDSKRNRSVEGTGLGLAIAKNLVEAMHGEIGVNSEYGKGSDFWFTIPQTVVDKTNEIYVENAYEKRVWVLDENEDMRDIFVKEVRGYGVDCDAISSLEEYEPGNKQEILFFTEKRYTEDVREFLEAHPQLSGIILVGLGSEFESSLPNLHVMRRPESTMRLVRMLNGRYNEIRSVKEDKVFRIDFTAPEARVLLVDDNHINLTIAEGLIAPLKMQVDTAGGGKEAIDKVRVNNYDLVFMDHMMPEIDGVDATRSIRAGGEDIHQPVIIALSANVMEEAKKLFYEAGMNDFVAKPIEVKELITTIKRWLPPQKILENSTSVTPESAQPEDAGLVNCEGFDTETAVRALGSAELYHEITGEYYRSGKDKLEGIRQAYEAENLEDYIIRVHALKSSSRQIGAMELGSLAEKLELAGKAGETETIRAENESLLKKFGALLEQLAPYYETGAADDSEKPPIEREMLLSLLDRLEQSCDDLDLDGMETVGDTLKQYAFEEETGARIEALRKAIAEIETDRCMELIAEIRARASRES